MPKVSIDSPDQLQPYIKNGWTDWGPSMVITRTMIDQFTALTKNDQWIHVDDERCQKESPYGAVIAHGLFILTLVPALLPQEDFDLIDYNQRIVRGSDRFRFPSAVYSRDRIHARTRIISVVQHAKGIVINREIEIWSHQGPKPVVVCELKLQYF